jgi:hypothetical protein
MCACTKGELPVWAWHKAEGHAWTLKRVAIVVVCLGDDVWLSVVLAAEAYAGCQAQQHLLCVTWRILFGPCRHFVRCCSFPFMPLPSLACVAFNFG